MKKLKLLLITLSLCGAILAGCGQKGAEKSATEDTITNADVATTDETKAVDTNNEVAADDTTKDTSVHFTDDDGREINLDAPATRIISLYSAHTENIYHLGGEGSLIGNYKTATYPADAASLPMFDYAADPEKVIAANPDVVLIRPFIGKKNPEFIEALEKAGIQVVSLYSESFEEFDSYVEKLGMILGKEEEAKEKLAQFHAEIEEITTITSTVEDKQTIFFESTDTNLRTVAKNSMPALAIKFAGGINIAEGVEPNSEGGSIAEYGEEKVLENANEIDVYLSQVGSMNSGADVETISARPGFNTIKAVKEGKVYVIDEKIISSPTFRYIEGIREIATIMYPEVMGK